VLHKLSANEIGDMSRPLCVLVVGERAAADVWSAPLARWGHRPLVAYDAAAAWAEALAQRPDVVLLDPGSTGVDGLGLSRRLLSDPVLHGVQIIALADHHPEDDLATAAAASGIH
jgi:CheY-like chemotaxis protein